MSTEVFSVPSSNPTSGASPINLAKEKLLKGLADLDRQRKSIMDVLAYMDAMERRTGYNLENAPSVRKDEFKGVDAKVALETYIRARRGFKIPLPRIAADLVEGGVYPGKPRGKKTDPDGLVRHTIKITLPNRRGTFGYEPDGINPNTGAHVIPKGTKDEDILVWLADTADTPKLRKRTK